MKHLMKPQTGSVDTEENWNAEGYEIENGLIEVQKDENGDWVEVK